MSNELIFSAVNGSVNFIGLLAKFTWTPSGLIHFAQDPCNLHFDKSQKNEIHSFICLNFIVWLPNEDFGCNPKR